MDSILIDGSKSELERWIDTDHCIIVDWRAEPEDILDEFIRFLPSNYLTYKSDYELPGRILLSTPKLSRTVRLPECSDAVNDIVLFETSKLISSEYEVHLFKSTLHSDTQCYLLRSKKWWMDYRKHYNKRYDELFHNSIEYHILLLPWNEAIKRPFSFLKALSKLSTQEN